MDSILKSFKVFFFEFFCWYPVYHGGHIIGIFPLSPLASFFLCSPLACLIERLSLLQQIHFFFRPSSIPLISNLFLRCCFWRRLIKRSIITRFDFDQISRPRFSPLSSWSTSLIRILRMDEIGYPAPSPDHGHNCHHPHHCYCYIRYIFMFISIIIVIIIIISIISLLLIIIIS